MYNIVKLCVAGGGKTTKIYEYIQELLKKNIDVDRILLISFSNSTVQELEKKLKIKAYTLHSFCIGFDNINSEIIENYHYLIDYLKNKYIKLRYISNITINNWIFNYLLYENTDIPQIHIEDIELNKQFRLLIKDIYNNIYNQRNFIEILQHFNNNINEILPLIYTKFDYLIIDEAQDLSLLQLQIIYKMIENVFSFENKGFIIVGDEQQIIYGFQGASNIEYKKFIHQINNLCKLRGLNMQIENHNNTYRFGGEILQHVNNFYNTHTSQLINGMYEKHNYASLQQICSIIENAVIKYGIDNILVLFKRNSEIIENIQNQLQNGLNIKIYLYDSILYKELQLIYYYLTTYGFTKQSINFINSIFKYTSYTEFLNNFCQYSHNNFLLFEYLNSIIYINDHLNKLLWHEIYNLCLQYVSFTEFFINLPLFITIQQNGIKFLTVHAAKGLEAKCVIFINEEYTFNSTIIYKGILLKHVTYNTISKEIYEQYMKEQIQQNKNTYYVAITRATEHLIELTYK